MENETIADIAAEIRRVKNPASDTTLVESAWLDDWAARLEAAWKRERAFNAMTEAANERLREHLQIALEGNKKPVGNAAAMREALANIAEYAKSALCHTEDSHVLGYLAQIENHAYAALSAPARNCDLFDNWYDAHQEWERLPKDKLGYYVDANGVHECEQAWLLAPAAGRKGDGDGSK